MRWIHLGSTPSIYLYHEPVTLTNKSIAGFNTTASIIPPDYTLTSTATLSGALLSDNNITLQCRVFVQDPPMIDTIVTEGTCIVCVTIIIMLICLFTMHACSARCNQSTI